MNDISRPFLCKFILVFFDDILVYSNSWEEHLGQLRVVLQRLRDHSLVANEKNCSFGQTSIKYLGHLLSEEGVAMDPSKVVSVLSWPIPHSVKGVLLGLTGYYCRFIRTTAKSLSH